MRVLEEALTFADVLLVPAYSEILPREVDLSTRVTRGIRLNVPLLSAAMDTVTEARLAIAIAQEGGIGVIHKSMSIEAQAREVGRVKKFESGVIRDPITVSPDMSIREVLDLTRSRGISGVPVVDTAHGHSKGVLDTVKRIKARWAEIQVIAGNIATAEAARALVDAGADAVKVGIGPGSICTTRVVAGVGVPQISAVGNVAEALRDADVPVISDGGIRFSGDIAKAIAAGAHAVMIGGLFAGTEESPGEVELYQGASYKSYRGMGSLGAMGERHGSSDRYFQDAATELEKLVPEGVEGRVPYKGSVVTILRQLSGGLRAAMGYTGSRNITDMRTRPVFVRITGAGIRESHVHDVSITKEAPNYRGS